MIPPGGEGEIKVTLKPKGTHTTISKNIVVYSNDPEQPRFTLTMKGTLLIDVVAMPPAVAIRDLAPRQRGSETFSVQRTDRSTAAIESVRIEDTKNFSIRKVASERGMLATYEVRFKGRKDIGVDKTTIVVQTDGENTPELKIPVHAATVYNLRYPKRFGFRAQGSGRPERTIRISTRRGAAPKIKKVVDPDALLDVEVLEPEGAVTSIRMVVKDGAVDKAGEGTWHTLWVHTNDRDEPKLELQYRVSAAPTPRRPKLAGR